MAQLWVHEMVDRLREVPTAQRKQVIDAYGSMTGYSTATLYRIAARNGFDSGRKARADKGVPKSGLTEDQIIYVAGLVEKTGRENKGGILPVEAAMIIAEDHGVIDPGQASPSTMQRLIRERQMDKQNMKAPTPSCKMRSLHPNHVHLVDVSVCIQYYLKNGRLGIMDERDFYKNKPDAFAKVKQKLLRYVITDHFSGAFYFRYYIAEGEGLDNLWDFLKRAWRPKGDSRLVLHGVCALILWDAASAARAGAMRNVLDRLGVENPKGNTYNPRRQGGVEVTHNIIERWFEPKLRIQPAWDVDILNEWADDFNIWYGATRIHSRHGATRTASWLQIKPEQLRLLPDDDVLQILFSTPEECTVVNYRISYRGDEYNLKHIPGLHHRAKVAAIVNPYRWKTERIIIVEWQGASYEVQAIAKLPQSQGGFEADAAIIGRQFKAQPENLSQKARKAIEVISGANGDKKATPFEGAPVFGHYADKVATLAALPKRGTPIEVARSVAAREISMAEHLKRLRDAVGRVTPEMNRELRAAFGESIDTATSDAVIAAIVEGRDWRPSNAPQRQAL